MHRLEHIVGNGLHAYFTWPGFETETYDGSKVLDYAKLEPHFGTSEEFTKMIKAIHKRIVVIADFPLAGVSANHVWVKEGTVKDLPAADGTIDWDHQTRNRKVLKEAIVDSWKAYNLDGIRLTD